jgi:hypothetical protein
MPGNYYDCTNEAFGCSEEPVDTTVTTKAVKFENQHQNQLFN